MPLSPVLLYIYCPHPLSCCIYTALIPCLAVYILPSYILPSSPVLLYIYCPHPLSCCIYTALIPCLAAYILPSSPVLLYICPHLSCCIYTALTPCLAVYILHLFLYLSLNSYILQHFNANVLLPCFTGFSLYTRLQIQCTLCLCYPTPFRCSWSCEILVGNNYEMAFNYMEVLVYRRFILIQERPYKDSVGERHCTWE